MSEYRQKYFKYKQKYLEYNKKYGGNNESCKICDKLVNEVEILKLKIQNLELILNQIGKEKKETKSFIDTIQKNISSLGSKSIEATEKITEIINKNPELLNQIMKLKL
jgi:hypothetical protein